MKTFRYFYWVITEFIKKYSAVILTTFLISFIFITFFLQPLKKFFFIQKKVGYVGSFVYPKMPDEILSLISNPLLTINDKGEYTPVLLSSWEIKDNFKTYRLVLKKAILWNDGQEIFTDDINFNLSDAEVKKIDKKTFLIKFKQPTPNFFKYLTLPILKKNLIGAVGKYKISRYRLKEGVFKQIDLLPNLENLPTISYIFYPTEEEMVIDYKLGKINQMILKNKNLSDSFKSWKNTKITQMIDYQSMMIIFFNHQKKFFENKEFRKILKDGINKNDFREDGASNSTPISLNSYYHNPMENHSFYSPDLVKEFVINNFLSKDKKTLSLKLFTYYDYYQIAEIIKNQLKEVNIDVSINFIRDKIADDFDLFLTLWEIPSVEDQYFYWHSQQKTTNISHYNNIRVDKDLEELRLKTDLKEKRKIAFELQKLFNDDPPAIFLYQPYIYLVERK